MYRHHYPNCKYLHRPIKSTQHLQDPYHKNRNEDMMLLPSISCHISNSNSNLATNLLLRRRRRSNSSSRRLHFLPQGAAEKDEPCSELELDTEKAREALQKLDQQLQSLAQQQQTQLPRSRNPSSPYSDINLDRDVITGMKSTEEMPEISTSYLSYAAVGLLLLTIFNNIIFNVIVKPSVDGYEQASPLERVPLKEP